MLLPARIAEGVRQGSITLAYRRWEQPRVRAGGTQLTSAGIVGFDAVDEVTDPTTITDVDARAAGFPDGDALRAYLARTAPEERTGAGRPSVSRRAGPRASKGGDRIFRVRLSWVGEDPRVQLRTAVPDAAELATITAAVAKLDAGKRSGPWTRPILEWIRDNPGVISTELAALLGRDVPPMKADIRRLKALGLTESLRIGYRLSPRGAAYLESLG
ncbi:MAG TPA: hypothetical protein VGK18_03390 [Propionicimonas sp.]|uniref:hypothetical protein n=1 Tax=Propionicimonas sp. TaxID=1955623 RepID=UPI002F3EB56B